MPPRTRMTSYVRPPRTRMPSYVRRAWVHSPWLRLLAALVRGCLLITITLCAFVHGPVDQSHRTPAPSSTVLTKVEPSSSHETPHGPHDHHTAEECVPPGVLRASATQSDLPPATDHAPLLSAVAVTAVRPPWRGRRRPHGRRRARTGRSALARSSRWRI
ncbi:hypothetical protein [Streptomyces heilongjiangensis]|uniref:Secreted protein n=1 Tax=Streptomyces heilongjiangensis TaxID=945052 RepID=A0ABW1B8A5_9ACTN|nr:hypothetical protein [Streptomyces heilongjiangensis]MDC2947443.1 hypothetical protein [Streptomyces heilongjiangensis]